MKTIKFKTALLILVLIPAFIFIGSCNKNYNPQINPEEPETQLQSLDEINVSENFEWNTTKNIRLTITGAQSQVITIYSMDQEVRYHRGLYEGNGEYIITLSVPNNVRSLLINNRTLIIDTDNIIFNLDQ